MDAKNAPDRAAYEMLSPESIRIFENVFDFFGLLDTEGRVVSLNGRIFRSTNTDPTLLSGQVFHETVFWQSSEMTSKLIANAILAAAGGQGSKLILDFRVSADDKIPVEVSIQLIDTSGLLFISGQSISDRRSQAGQNREAREQLLFAAENAAIGLWFWDLAADRIYATARCNELFGLSSYETYRYESYRMAIHPEDRDFVDTFIAKFRDHGLRYEEEFRVVYADGTVEWLLAEGRSFVDENGKPERMTGVVQKITDQRLAAEEVAKVHEREKKARDEAVHANQAKNDFLSFISHELRGQLNNILGWLNILRTKTVDEDRRKSALEIVERSARAQKKLLDDLVDIGRVESGRLRLEYRPTNLYDIVRNTWQAHLALAQEKKITLDFVTDTENIPLFGDPSRLLQVFGNLLSNAVKFTPEGGEVTIEIETGSDTVSVRVIDTGYGIDAALLPSIFDQFAQGVTMGKTNVGLGLGLSIVKILVGKHRGWVKAESEGVGKGSIFTVTLPLAETRVVEPNAPDDNAENGKLLAECFILIVEDDPDSREVLELFLVQNGARVKSFDSVRSALANFGANVVISDLGMPDEDGYSLIRKIRSLPPESGGNVPAVALSAFTSEDSRRKALEFGFNRYCTKPFEHDQLINDLLELINANR